MSFIVTSCAFKIHRVSGPGRGKPVLLCILACSLGFHAITLERSTSTKIAIFKNQASVEMNLLVSLFCCLVARGGRKHGNRHIHRHRHTNQVYRNTRCACAARVNKKLTQMTLGSHK